MSTQHAWMGFIPFPDWLSRTPFTAFDHPTINPSNDLPTFEVSPYNHPTCFAMTWSIADL